MMQGWGSGDNGEITFLDAVAIISFLVGLQNLELNITQDDMDAATRKLDRALRIEVDAIHSHLEQQDEKIDKLLKAMERRNHENSSRDIQRYFGTSD